MNRRSKYGREVDRKEKISEIGRMKDGGIERVRETRRDKES